MIKLPDFEYVSHIKATRENARAMQALTLQDLRVGGFENPTNLADPYDLDLVRDQLIKLHKYPERYSGYVDKNGLPVAYMKAAEWLADDEAPFAVNLFARKSLILSRMLGGGSLKPKAYGVFGLVAGDLLPVEERGVILRSLLVQSIGQAAAESASVVNIVSNSQDPAIHTIEDLGFLPKGPSGEAAGAPGLIQQRYQRPVAGLSSLIQ